MRKRRFGGNSSPDGWEPPRGGAWARGANGKPQSPAGRRGLPGAPLGGAGGGKQRASNEQARRQMVGSPLGGAWEGVRTASPKVPQGVGAYRTRPWVGRGKIAAGKAVVPPNYGGEGG